jgi:threonyl-tRNA synthetase
MLIVGDKEMAASGVSVRLRSGEDLSMEALLEVKKRIITAIEARS